MNIKILITLISLTFMSKNSASLCTEILSKVLSNGNSQNRPNVTPSENLPKDLEVLASLKRVGERVNNQHLGIDNNNPNDPGNVAIVKSINDEFTKWAKETDFTHYRYVLDEIYGWVKRSYQPEDLILMQVVDELPEIMRIAFDENIPELERYSLIEKLRKTFIDNNSILFGLIQRTFKRASSDELSYFDLPQNKQASVFLSMFLDEFRKAGLPGETDNQIIARVHLDLRNNIEPYAERIISKLNKYEKEMKKFLDDHKDGFSYFDYIKITNRYLQAVSIAAPEQLPYDKYNPSMLFLVNGVRVPNIRMISSPQEIHESFNLKFPGGIREITLVPPDQVSFKYDNTFLVRIDEFPDHDKIHADFSMLYTLDFMDAYNAIYNDLINKSGKDFFSMLIFGLTHELFYYGGFSLGWKHAVNKFKRSNFYSEVGPYFERLTDNDKNQLDNLWIIFYGKTSEGYIVNPKLKLLIKSIDPLFQLVI